MIKSKKTSTTPNKIRKAQYKEPPTDALWGLVTRSMLLIGVPQVEKGRQTC
jgi:hypothetical protein